MKCARGFSNEEVVEEAMHEMGIEELKDTLREAILPEGTHLLQYLQDE